MTTEIYIEKRFADISSGLSSLLTLAIDDIKNFGSRQTSFTKTVVMPGTANNNKLFGDVFEISVSNSYDPSLPNIGINFNASVSANCIVFQDFMQTFSGTIRLLEIIIDKGQIEYSVALTGQLFKLNVALTSSLLEALDFSEYNLTWDETNIVASWDNTPGSGVYFPLADYGTYSDNKHDWDFRTLRPALYVREYLDKMITAAGFRWQSDLLDTDRFKRLVIPHNQKDLRSQTSAVLRASVSTSHIIIKTIFGDTSDPAPWDSIQAGAFGYSAGLFTYNDPTTISGTISWKLSGTQKATTASHWSIHIQVNGSDLASQSFIAPPGGFPVPYIWASSAAITLNQFDVVRVFYTYDGIGTELEVNIAPVSTLAIDTSTPAFVAVAYGQEITMNDAIPKNIRQIDFLVSIIKLFNLYIYEDKFDPSLIYIKPYIDFYSTDSTDSVDWTFKVDRGEPTRIAPMSEINAKIYLFKYADDSDYYNDLYKKRYNLSYGSYIYDTAFEFIQSTITVDLIFASTPLVGYGGEEKVYPTIFKLTNDEEERIDSVIRIFQTKKITGVASWQILDGASVLTSPTSYGYGGHFDDPDNVANDLNFGATEELFFILVSGDLTVTQFNVYWTSYMAEITDKDSKMLVVKVKLDVMDIYDIDFSKYVYIDGNLFRLMKITDYNLTTPDTCEVQLLKVINTLY